MSQLDKIQQKEVTRKEFLTILGAGLLSIMGLSTILKLLGHKGLLDSPSNHQASSGYGSGPYGK